MLWAIWITSIILSAISLAVMVVLILRRLVLQKRADIKAGQRARLQKALIEFSDTHDAAALRQVLPIIPPAVTLEAGFEFLALLRGDEHARIIAMFTQAGLVDQAKELLKRGNQIERIHAAEMLGAFSDGEGTKALHAAFADERSEEVLIAIAISLSQLGRLPPLDHVLSRVGEAGKWSRRLIDLFGRLPADRATELNDYAARIDEPPFARAAAIETLGNTGDPLLLEFMQSLANDPSADVAAAAIRALGRIGHPAAVAAVIRAMGDRRQSDLRADAAEAAGRIGASEFTRPLADLLGDDVWSVRYAAGRALRLIPGGIEHLRAVAQGAASSHQRMASLVLSEGEIK